MTMELATLHWRLGTLAETLGPSLSIPNARTLALVAECNRVSDQPSVAELAHLSDVTDNAMTRRLGLLVEAGLVTADSAPRAPGVGGRPVLRYTVTAAGRALLERLGRAMTGE